MVSACKLTCLWCHHKIMFYKIPRGATTTLWVTGISDPLQIYYGRLDEHDWWYAILDTKIWLTDITQFLLAHSYVALENDMLKSYKVAQVWIFFSGWLQEAYFLKTKSNNNNNLCIWEQSIHHHRHWMTTTTMYGYWAKEDDGVTEGTYCSCTAGYEIYACFCYSLSCLCSANSGPLDNNRRDCNQSWLKYS